MNLPVPEPTPPSELIVVGERRDDPLCLLLLGADANFYAYSITDGSTEHVVPDQEWRIEESLVETMRQELASRGDWWHAA